MIRANFRVNKEARPATTTPSSSATSCTSSSSSSAAAASTTTTTGRGVGVGVENSCSKSTLDSESAPAPPISSGSVVHVNRKINFSSEPVQGVDVYDIDPRVDDEADKDDDEERNEYQDPSGAPVVFGKKLPPPSGPPQEPEAKENDDDEEQDEEEDDDDEEEEEEEEEEYNHYIAKTVQVKYDVEYEYDDKKFTLVKGEHLYLIDKSNQDWWLCIRLDERLTFFVPASYVSEVVNRVPPKVKPPPRPPPPPPPTKTVAATAPVVQVEQPKAAESTPPRSSNFVSQAVQSIESSISSSASASKPKPEVKQRNQFLRSASTDVATIETTPTTTTTTTKQQQQQQSIQEVEQIYENLAPVLLKRTSFATSPATASEKPATTRTSAAALPAEYYNADDIINELDECLDREDGPLIANANANANVNVNAAAAATAVLAEPTAPPAPLVESIVLTASSSSSSSASYLHNSASLTATTSKANSGGSTATTTAASNCGSIDRQAQEPPMPPTPEPDYDDKHIYQNFPIVVPTKRSSQQTTPKQQQQTTMPGAARTRNSYVEQTESKSAVNKSKLNQRYSLTATELADMAASAVGSTTDAAIKAKMAAANVVASTAAEANRQSKQQQQQKQQHEEESVYAADEDCDDEENDEASAPTVAKDAKRTSRQPAAKSAEIYEDDDEGELQVPRGWHVGLTKCKRKFFYNDLNKDRWYLNYDAGGKYYFYNAEGQSVWTLPSLYADDRNGGDAADDEAGHFNRNFDEDLSTFNNLHARLSNRQVPGQTATTAQATTGSLSYQHVPEPANKSTASKKPGFFSSSSSSNAAVKSGSGQPTAAASASAKTTTINYSYKPPTGLSADFKCTKLAENGKRCKKRNVESYKVQLASTKLLFIKSVKPGKIDFFADFKGGKCYKVDKSMGLMGSAEMTSKQLKDKEKDRQEVLDLVGSNRFGFVLETLIGYRILLISDNAGVVQEWVAAINSIITQMQSEFSPIYEGPESLHVTSMAESEPSASAAAATAASASSRPTQKPPLPNIFQIPGSSGNQKNKDLDSASSSYYTLSDDYAAAAAAAGSKGAYYYVGGGGDYHPDDLTSERFNEFLAKYTAERKESLAVSGGEQWSDSRLTAAAITFYRDYVAQDAALESRLALAHPGSGALDSSTKPPPVIKKENLRLIKKMLNAFLKKRPPIESLKHEGIIKECVFGSNLISLCRREKRTVPLFVDDIIAAIEAKGVDVDGIYRISGNLVEVQKVRHQVDHGKHNFKDFDIHVLCGALKTFFRELEEPLVPFSLHQDFLMATNIQDKARKFASVQELLKRMPVPHRETIRTLTSHLLKVVKQSAQNRMSVQNVALVFGPNIMRSNPLNEANNGFNPHIITQNILVEYMLTNFRELFSFPSDFVYENK